MLTDSKGQLSPIDAGIGVVAAYVLTPSAANAPGPGDVIIAVDDIAHLRVRQL